jgi:hypothetical protein
MLLAQLSQLLLDFKDRIFSVSQDDKFGGLAANNLTTQLAANRTATPRYQHALVAQEVVDAPSIGGNRLAAQKVFDIHRAQLA